MTGGLDTFLGYQLRRASAAMIADLTNSLSELGLTVVGMSVLLTIAESPDRSPRSQSEIGRILGIQRANLVPLAATLVEQELISRVAVDGRSHALVLTPAGKRSVAQARRIVARHEAKFLPQLAPSERAQLVGLLATIWR